MTMLKKNFNKKITESVNKAVSDGERGYILT